MTAAEHSADFELVLACLRWPKGPQDGETIRSLAQQPVDWSNLLDIARQHKVTPLVARSLDAFAADCLPEAPAALLRAANVENAHTCLRRIAHLLSLLRKFREHGMGVRVFKGIPLAIAAFQDPTVRDAGDIDLLVAEQDLFAAGEILRAEGYVRFEPQGRLTPRRIKSYVAHQKDFSYAHPTAGTVIDLHWRLFRNPWLPANAGIAESGESWIELEQERLATLPLPQLLVYLCMHGALDGWLRLKWLADVCALFQVMSPDQLAAATAAAAEQQALPQLSAAIYLCQDLLHFPAPAPGPLQSVCLDREDPLVARILTFSRRAMTSNHYRPVREHISGVEWFLNEWHQYGSPRYRRDLVERSLFRPRVWSTIQLPDWLFPLYVLLSPFEWLSFQVRHGMAMRRQGGDAREARPGLFDLRWLRRRPADLALAMEAACLLSFFRIALRLLSVEKVVTWMGRPAAARLPLAGNRQSRTLRRVEWSIGAVTRHAPLTFVCFPQSLAAYFMLRRRHIASTLFYGVTREDDCLKAHTWVKVGDRTVVGGEEAAAFTVLNTFP